MISRALILGLLAVAGCGSSSRTLVTGATPLNGSTAMDLTTTPGLVLGDGATIDAGDRRVVLYDVTAGARKTIAGQVEVAGSSLVYHPTDALPADHELELTVERAALGGGLDERDASERPEEPIAWPLRLAFSTANRPRVRAAYLDRTHGSGRVSIHFSQAMSQASTSPELSVVDLTGKPWPASPPIWADDRTAHLDLKQALDPATPYRLQVGAGALSTTGVALDGNRDGRPGDAFSAAFSGSQAIILSRQPQ